MMGHRTPKTGRRHLDRFTVTTTPTPEMYSFSGTPPPWCHLVEGFFHSNNVYTTTAYDTDRLEFIALNTVNNVYELVDKALVLENLREGIYIVSAHGVQQWKLVAYNNAPNLQTIIVDAKGV